MQRTAQEELISGNPNPSSVRIKIKEGLDPAPFLVFAKFLLEKNVVWRPPAARTSCVPKAELGGEGHSTLLSMRKRRISEQHLGSSNSPDLSPSQAKRGHLLSHVIDLELSDSEKSIVSEVPLLSGACKEADKMTSHAFPVVVLKDVIQEELMLHSLNNRPDAGIPFEMESAKERSSASAIDPTFAGQETKNRRQRNWPPPGLNPEPFHVMTKFLEKRNIYLGMFLVMALQKTKSSI
ncbi:uncharacterized protein LOC144147210 isoform X3 [Haemaphysalis longicornis]